MSIKLFEHCVFIIGCAGEEGSLTTDTVSTEDDWGKLKVVEQISAKRGLVRKRNQKDYSETIRRKSAEQDHSFQQDFGAIRSSHLLFNFGLSSLVLSFPCCWC